MVRDKLVRTKLQVWGKRHDIAWLWDEIKRRQTESQEKKPQMEEREERWDLCSQSEF